MQRAVFSRHIDPRLERHTQHLPRRHPRARPRLCRLLALQALRPALHDGRDRRAGQPTHDLQLLEVRRGGQTDVRRSGEDARHGGRGAQWTGAATSQGDRTTHAPALRWHQVRRYLSMAEIFYWTGDDDSTDEPDWMVSCLQAGTAARAS